MASDGSTVTPVPTPANSAVPPPPPAPPPAVAPRLTRLPLVGRRTSPRRRRIAASTLLLFASLVLVVSMAVSWWGFSATGGGTSVTVSFLPGSTFWTTSTAGGASSNPYDAAGIVHVGQLYEAVLGVGLTAAVAGFVATALGFLGLAGALRSRLYGRLTLIFTAVAFLGTAILPVLTAAAQPAALSADNTQVGAPGGAGCGTGTSPCNAFWGTLTNGGTHVGWGADIGWYLAVAAVVLLLLALWQLLLVRRSPLGAAEAWTASGATPGVAGTEWSESPPLPAAPVGEAAAASTAPPCPSCGAPLRYVVPYSRWYCDSERTYV